MCIGRLLTILGLIVVRACGWVVGDAGLLGVLLIIIATFVITDPEADIYFGLAREVDPSLMVMIERRARSSCLFVRDSGRDSALA